MSIYFKDASVNNGDLTQTEIHLYACPASCGSSSRLGVYNLKISVQRDDPNPDRIITFTRGEKFFELSNHLGNACPTKCNDGGYLQPFQIRNYSILQTT